MNEDKAFWETDQVLNKSSVPYYLGHLGQIS